MTFRSRIAQISQALKKGADHSLRTLEKKTGIPKSSVQRHKVKRQARINSMGHDFFETEIGVKWLERLFQAVIMIFGIQAGVGSETIALFFEKIFLSSYVASSPSSIRKTKKKMRVHINNYGITYMKEIFSRCKNRVLHMGADETWFGQSIFLVLMELRSGFIFTEALVNNRTYQTWCKATKGVLKHLKNIVSFTTDAGKAIIKLGKKCNCNNGMDLFHLQQDMKKLFATKFHSKRRSLLFQLEKLQEEPIENKKEQKAAIASLHLKLKTIDKGQQDYRHGLFSVSVLTHPFRNITEKKTSKELEKQLHTELEKFRSIARVCEIEDKKNLLDRFGDRIESAAQLNDPWHDWVEQSVLCKTDDPAIKQWGTACLLPYFYYKEQLRKSKKKVWLRKHYKKVLRKSKKLLYAHPLTKEYLHDDWINWAQSMTLKYQRSSSAIEGRNARLTQHYFSARGIRRSHITSLTVLHNFWIKRKDKTTAAERLCGFKPPDLFEYILENMGDIPLPRKRKSKMAFAI